MAPQREYWPTRHKFKISGIKVIILRANADKFEVGEMNKFLRKYSLSSNPKEVELFVLYS